MRLLITSYDYPQFVEQLYAASPGLADSPYAAQVEARADSLFSVLYFYAESLQRLGVEAIPITCNLKPAQWRWAREHGISPPERGWTWAILQAQLAHYRPDVWLAIDSGIVPAEVVAQGRTHCGAVVGLQSARIRKDPWGPFDLMLSSIPPLVDRFRELGYACESFRLCFEPGLLKRLPEEARDLPLVFTGSLFDGEHAAREAVLRRVLTQRPIEMWGLGLERLAEQFPDTARLHGVAFGREMYSILARAQVCLNVHGEITEGHANNMRLYEATGMGALLLTDRQSDLSDYFEPEVEVVSFRDPEECQERLAWLEAEPGRRGEVAAAGQRRTLSEHTYDRRAQELMDILSRHGMA